MASIVSAGTTSATALNMSADTTGILQLASNNGTVALTISTSQNVGIGTSSPSCLLDVQKAAGANFVATFQNTTAATPYCVFIKDAASSTAGYPLLAVTDSTGASTYLRVDSSNGNVGMGTAPTSYKLDVSSTASPVVRFQSNNANGLYLDFYNGSTTPLYVGFGPTLVTGASTSDGVIRYKSGNSLIFSQAGANVARFNDGGNFLIGTTTTNNMSGTLVQTLGSSGIIDASSASVANGGTLVLTANSSGASFTGFLAVSNVVAANAAQRTQTLYAIMGRGTTLTATSLASANGSTSGASFTLTCPSAGALTVTNTSGSTTLVNMTYIGHNSG